MINIKFGKVEDFNKNTDFYKGVIPAGINTKQDLLKSYADVFKFPEYFGFNWDALEECLSDFHWLEGIKHILIYHMDVPQIDEKDTKILLEILNRSAGDGSGGSLIIVFPEKYKDFVEKVLENKSESKN